MRKNYRRARRSKPRRQIGRLSRLVSALRRWRIPKGLRRAFAHAPGFVQGAVIFGLAALLWFTVNGLYQVIRKPSELFFPVSGTLNKTPSETWRDYGPLFRRYSTQIVTAELLAGLAQIEGSGNPVARTYWRWSLTARPFEVYRPASSSVGMYQITDGTFAQARRYCIRRHTVVEDGPWNEWHSCWFNGLYTRVIPSHAVELTAAYLDRSVTDILARHPGRFATLEREQELAALIHLCGAGAADAYVRHGMRLAPGQRCGDHDAHEYLARVEQARRVFQALEAQRGR
ncbi:MAG TPA: hypothetical protein VHY75_06360 [Steroidobacteraceae bacterium]|jgi:hypothetical protein|nr:hypothetical protein [Steroidobacteraceae bacterium]